MPRFNPVTGAIADQRRDWYDATRTVFQDCTPGYCQVILSDGTVLARADAPTVTGGGSVAAWENSLDGAVHDTVGRRWTGAGLSPGGSPDGAYALKVKRNSYGPWDVIEADGSRWRLTDGDAHDIQLFGGRAALWKLGNDYACTPGLPILFPTELAYGGRAAYVMEEFRYVLGYQRQSDGGFVIDGHLVLPPSASYFYYDLEYRTGLVRLTWSASQADVNPQLREFPLAWIHAQPVSPAHPDPIPPSQYPAAVPYVRHA